jgi:putative nucleotidyltransferase with HDIG domain
VNPRPVSGRWLVLLGILLVTVIIQFAVHNQRAFLNFYYLPVVLGSWLLGRQSGVIAAVLACFLVGAIAFMNDAQFVGADPSGFGRWLDLGTWGCFLVLTSYVVGSLNDSKEAQVRELRDAYAGIIEIMGKFIDSIDRHTENHSRRVAEHSVRMAQAMNLSEIEVEDIRVGAYLHDIGKIEVSTEVLQKATRLTPAEYAEMQRHVERGEQLVRKVGGILRHVIPMVAFHHERWDGTGYKGLVGENIPLGARIISVADTYDAIVSDRAYRAGRSHEEALRIIREESGKQFDPRVVDVFLQVVPDPAEEVERLAA